VMGEKNPPSCGSKNRSEGRSAKRCPKHGAGKPGKAGEYRYGKKKRDVQAIQKANGAKKPTLKGKSRTKKKTAQVSKSNKGPPYKRVPRGQRGGEMTKQGGDEITGLTQK